MKSLTPVLSLTGNDVCTINNRVLSDFADGDVAELAFENDIASIKTGKNGVSLFARSTTGAQATLKLRIVRGSPDDIFLNQLLAFQQNNFNHTPLLIGSFVKSTGDGLGSLKRDTYDVSDGVFLKQVSGKTNTDGDVGQSVAVYTIKFANAPRTPNA